MKPKLYLHIGLHKTGSTFIQNFCAQNREQLAKKGVLYHQAAIKWNGHHPLVWSLGIRHPHHDPAEGDTESLAGKIINESKGYTSIVLSSEDFEFLAPVHMKRLLELFEDFDIRIIAYLRRQDSYLESEYAQHVRMDETRSAGEIRDFYMSFDFMQRYNYMQLLRPWDNHFGKDALLIRPFQRAQMVSGSLADDFCATLGLTDAAGMVIPEEAESNISFSGTVLGAMREVNKLELTAEDRSQVLEILMKYSRKESETILAPRNLESFMKVFEKTNARVAQRYLGRSDGQLFLAEDETSSS
jgi:hypothetical protein